MTTQDVIQILPLDDAMRAQIRLQLEGTENTFDLTADLWQVFFEYQKRLTEIEFARLQTELVMGDSTEHGPLWTRAEEQVQLYFADVLSGKVAKMKADEQALHAVRDQMAQILGHTPLNSNTVN
ncbi:MAG: hypothetical protein ACOYK6_08860 [Chthoniobacterales bacterium]